MKILFLVDAEGTWEFLEQVRKQEGSKIHNLDAGEDGSMFFGLLCMKNLFMK